MKKLVLLGLLGLPLAYADTLLGPTPYLSSADSPFNGGLSATSTLKILRITCSTRLA